MARRIEGRAEVTFVKPGGELTIRMTDNSYDSICEAAKTLKARYVVMIDEWDHHANLPIWAVYNAHKAQRHGGAMGWVMPLPEKRFTVETSDAAVMWAIAKLGTS